MSSLLKTQPFGCTQLEALFRHQLLHRSAGDLLKLLTILVPIQLALALFRVPEPGPSLFCSVVLFAIREDERNEGIGLTKSIALLLAHLWAHIVGLYSFSTSRKIGRAVFLNARHALDNESELQNEVGRMAQILSGSLPPHIVRSVQSQLGVSEVPRVFVEHFDQCSVVYAHLYGLPNLLLQLQPPDSAKLLNEFDWRVAKLAEESGLLLVPATSSEIVVALVGLPLAITDSENAQNVQQQKSQQFSSPYNAAAIACQFSIDLLNLCQSFCEATNNNSNNNNEAQLQIRVGIGSGSLSAGIVGSRRWHYDVMGMAIDAALHLEANCPAGAILLSEDTWRHLAGGKFAAERMGQGAWKLLTTTEASPIVQPLLFPTPSRRLSLLTLQQLLLRLLQQQQPKVSAFSNALNTPVATFPAPTTPFTKRSVNNPFASKGRLVSVAGSSRRSSKIPRIGSCRQLDSATGPPLLPGINPLTLKFIDTRLERTYHAQPDRWLIPGLALCVLFLALFGLFQALAMPRMLPNLATLALALILMFLLLLALYTNFLESFCHFVTRTSLGYCVTVLLVLTALCTCGLANTFSCPTEPSPSDITSTPCQPHQLSAVSLALWMLLCSAFLRLSSSLLLLILLSAIALFCPHIFLTHFDLYPNLLTRLDILTLLIGLSLLIFLLARRNELLLRMDFLALLKGVEDGKKLERTEFLNDQILRNVGILCAKLGRPGDWVGEFGFDRLNRLVCEIDQRLGQLSESSRLEKVRTSHCFYTAACGILPELAKNVHDAPCTIGEQLSSLAELAQFIQDLAESEALDIAIGMDCGSALSVVVGGDKPRYELLGQPNTRAKKLAEAASALGGSCVLLSEDVFLALRPRSQFHFDENSALSVGPGLVAYSLLNSPSNQTASQFLTSPLPPPLPPHRTNSQQQNNTNKDENEVKNVQNIQENGQNPTPHIRANPLSEDALIENSGVNNNNNNIHSSAQSLCSSELLSIDLNLETDSLELEWVTPEMVANGQYRLFPESPPLTNINKKPKYKADRADVYSELSDPESYHPHTQERSKMGTFNNKLWRHPSSVSTNNEASYRSHPSTNTSLDRKLIVQQQKQTTTKPYKRGRHFSKNSSKNGGNNSAFSGSEFSLSLLAGDDYRGYNNYNNNTTSLQRLNKAANRMERMLKEMAGVPTTQKTSNQGGQQPECPFPREDWTNNNKLNNDIDGRYYCHHHNHHSMSEYENATNSQRSLAASCCSDFESAIDKDEEDKQLSLSSFFQFNNQKRKSISKLERLRQALILNNDRNWRSNSSRPAANNNSKRINIKCDGNEADRSCSPSIGSMQQFSPTTTTNNHERLKTKTAKLLKTLKWRQSVSHSIGYEDEYEIASAPLSSYASSVSATSWGAENNKNIKLLPSVGENTHFIPIDDDEEDKNIEDKNNNNGDKIIIKEQQLIDDNNSRAVNSKANSQKYSHTKKLFQN
uniref:adenylate cyclase n=1 Tax=Meloidogyne floridensis TaxID=298350 RepID=A0A915NYT0_9BILA